MLDTLGKISSTLSFILLLTSCASTRISYQDLSNRRFQIMGYGVCSEQQLAGFLIQNNSNIDSDYAFYIATFYLDESQTEGVNSDVAFAQMCLETGFLQYGGATHVTQNNFSGLGAVNNHTSGESFPSIEIGIRAHIQHLKAYGSTEHLNQDLVDNRFDLVERGSAPTIFHLAERWSTDSHYGYKIKSLINRLLASH